MIPVLQFLATLLVAFRAPSLPNHLIGNEGARLAVQPEPLGSPSQIELAFVRIWVMRGALDVRALRIGDEYRHDFSDRYFNSITAIKIGMIAKGEGRSGQSKQRSRDNRAFHDSSIPNQNNLDNQRSYLGQPGQAVNA